MGYRHPQGFYDDETVAALAQAYREAWNTLAPNDISFEASEWLRQSIVDTMMELASEGVVSADELRDAAIAAQKSGRAKAKSA